MMVPATASRVPASISASVRGTRLSTISNQPRPSAFKPGGKAADTGQDTDDGKQQDDGDGNQKWLHRSVFTCAGASVIGTFVAGLLPFILPLASEQLEIGFACVILGTAKRRTES